MKLNSFFLNCLNRRSFHFLSFVGFFLLVIPLAYWKVACLNDYVANVFAGGFLIVLFLFLGLIIPTLGLVTILSIIAIYLKLLHREYKDSEYRIKNKVLTKNPFYGFFAFIFYIFAIFSITGLLYLASATLEIYKEDVFHDPIYVYAFIIYIFIHIVIVKKI